MSEPNATLLRLNPRTKFFMQLAARNAGVGFAEFLETLLGEYLDFATVLENGIEKPMRELMAELWSDNEADRIALIGNRFPELLTERERVLWQRIICESPAYWKVPLTGAPIVVSDETFRFDVFRKRFHTFDGLTRDEVIVTANQLKKQKKQSLQWPNKQSTNKESE